MPHQALDRPPLRESALRRILELDQGPWREIRVLEETGSTNADALAAAAAGAPEGLVVVAERQFSGRGRHGRAWESPARAGLTFSVLVRPAGIAAAQRGWLPLLAGLAVADAIGRVTDIETTLKWPNDALVRERKVGGILAEVAGDGAVVLGIGVNVSQRSDELPVSTATSLALEGAAVDRESLLRAILRDLAVRYTMWRACNGRPDVSSLDTAYARRSATLGRTVCVLLPGDEVLDGEAVGVDDLGQLLVQTADGDHAVSAGEVVHIR